MLYYLLLCSLFLGASFGDAALAFGEMKQQMHEQGFMEALPTQLLSCLAENRTISDETCGQLDYIGRLHAMWAAAAKAGPVAKPATIELESSDYTSQFERNIAKNMPYKGLMSSSKFSTATALSTCIMEYGIKLNDLSKDIPVSECSSKNRDIFQEAVMPRIVGNDYLPRWTAARELFRDEGALLNYRTHWPAFLPLYDVTPMVHRCPVGLHMVVWGARGPVKARLFDVATASHLLKPSLGSDVLHYFQYAESGFATDPELYSETILEEGQFLFVPQTMLASFDSGASSSNNALLKSCFVDASNLKDVREQIAMEAAVAQSSRIWLKEIDHLSFSYIMTRTPADFPMLGGGDVAADGTDDIGAEKKSGRRNRGSGMRDLGDAASWANLITALTLPVPTTPIFTDVGLQSSSIEWSSYFVPSSVDKTAYGFTLTVCEARNKDACYVQDISGANLKGRVSAKESNVQIFQAKIITFLKPATEYIARVNMYYGSSIGYLSDYSFVTSTKRVLPPSAIPGSVLAAISKDDPSTALLTFSVPTSDGGAPIVGYNIFANEMQKMHGFTEVRKLGLVRPADAASSQVSVTAKQLAPGVKYVFSVSAQNAAGAGPISATSQEVETPWIRGNDSPTIALVGATTEMHVIPAGTPSFPLLPDGAWNPAKRLLTMKNKAETLSVIDETTNLMTIQVWRSHWNANVDVTAHAVWMDPVQGQVALKNSRDLQNKIAVVHRGAVSFVHKARAAQVAGALALIIVDDGTCKSFDQSCVPGSSQPEGFAASDLESAWDTLRIPVFLAMKMDWDNLVAKWSESPAQEVKRLEPARQALLQAMKEAEALATSINSEL